jgi:putative ribosome biogenesis GTPase RsgA
MGVVLSNEASRIEHRKEKNNAIARYVSSKPIYNSKDKIQKVKDKSIFSLVILIKHDTQKSNMTDLKRRAQSSERRIYFNALRNLVILLLDDNNLLYISFLSEKLMILLNSNITRMLATSKIDLLEIFKNCENSLLEKEPDPSAMLFDMLIVAVRSCSANLYILIESALSAISNKLFDI